MIYLATVSLLGLQEGLHDQLLVEDAVAILGTGEQLSGVRLTGRASLREVLVELERELAGAELRARAGGRRVVNAGAERVAHEASEEAVAVAGGEPSSRRAPRWRRGGRPLEHRHGAVVVVVQVPPLERWRRVGVRVGVPAGDAQVVGSVVPQRAEVVVSRGAGRRGRSCRRGEEARQAAAAGGQAVRGSRRRGRSGGGRRRATGGWVKLRRVDRARRTGVQGNRGQRHRRNRGCL